MLSMLSVLTLCVLAASGPAPAQPVVPNASLEAGQDTPDGWSSHAGEDGTGEFVWDDTLAHSGTRSFRVHKIGAVGHTLLSGPMVPVEGGKTYRVGAWVYPHRNLRGGVYFMVSQFPAGKDEWDLPNTFGDTHAILVGGQWQELSLAVAVRPGNDRLRIQCVQALAPSTVNWDDFAVTEADAEPEVKPRYEPPTKEALPDLEAARAIVARRPRAQVELIRTAGRPRLLLDGRPTPWAWYVGPFWDPDDAQIADFRDAGVRVYLVPLVLGRNVYADRGPWLGPNRWDFSEVDDLLWRVLRVDPHAYVVFYMACDPYREWGADNPDHVTRDQEGRRAIVEMHPRRWGDDPTAPERFGPSLVSLKLREDVAETLRRLTAHVEANEAGKAVIGYHVAGFNDGQWFQWARFDPKDLHLADYCPGAQQAFRAWLSRRYAGDVQALRAAWNQPEVTFETAAVPAGERLWGAESLLDPATQGDIADHTRFYSEGVAENVMALAQVLKTSTPRRILCGTYYEDITCNSANHIALGRFLDSDALDFLAGPAAYGIRMAGWQGAVRSVFASTLLHGKTYLTEQDWRSWHSEPNPSPQNNFSWGRAETAEVHSAMVRRECGMMLAFGLGTWWYDMSGGWFRDDGIMAGIAEAMGAFERDLSVEQPPRADLAVFVGEDSDSWVAPAAGGAYRHGGVTTQIHELNLAGVPYRLYLQSDLADPGLPEHRAYLFLNAYLLTPREREAVETLKRDGKLLIFVHAPGHVGAKDPAAELSAITGMALAPAEGVTRLGTTPLEDGSPLLADVEGAINYPTAIAGPAYEVTDPEATPLAHYVTTRRLAAATRDFGSWKSAFIGAPGLRAAFVHNLAAWAGCWCAAGPWDAVYANQRIVTVHAIFTGRKTLTLPGPSRVTDLQTGAVVGERLESIEMDMRRGETRWFWLDPQ